MLTKEDLLLGKLKSYGVSKLRTSEVSGKTTLTFYMNDGSERLLSFPNGEWDTCLPELLKRAEDILRPN